MKNQAPKIVQIVFYILIGLLIYSRYVNLDWGLPYPMHPDERNMSVAIMQLKCPDDPSMSAEEVIRVSKSGSDSLFMQAVFTGLNTFRNSINDCFNPRFFAYGQFPLYLAYVVVQVMHVFNGNVLGEVSFEEATIALRLISATASIIAAFVLYRLIRVVLYSLDHKKGTKMQYFLSGSITSSMISLSILFIIIFIPGFIQFAHFGTTESLLMMFYVCLVYVSILFIRGKMRLKDYIFRAGVFSGLGLATKLTAAVFLAVPAVVLLGYGTSILLGKKDNKGYLLIRFLGISLLFVITTALVGVIFSPYNVLSLQDFLGSMRFEADVATGSYVAFYTRQFEDTVPLLFHSFLIFPHVLGTYGFISSVIGFFILPWKRKDILLVRFALVIFLVTQLVLFAKWSRFIAPVIPFFVFLSVISTFSILHNICTYLSHKKIFSQKIPLFSHYVIWGVLVSLAVFPGIIYMRVYTEEDPRFVASRWIFEHIAPESKILSETANVIDIPVRPPKSEMEHIHYTYKSFNSYDLEVNPELPIELENYVSQVDYIFIPSRRVFANHTCFVPHDYRDSYWGLLYRNMFFKRYEDTCNARKQRYPKLNAYYKDLFSGDLGFEHVVSFSLFPGIQLGPFLLAEFPDEDSEETWTVFDHPVIRIYKRSQI